MSARIANFSQVSATACTLIFCQEVSQTISAREVDGHGFFLSRWDNRASANLDNKINNNYSFL